MLRLTVVEGVDRDRVFEGETGMLTLGASPECEVQLSDQFVSKQHGQFFLTGDDWHYRDLGSTNGSVVEGEGSRTALPGQAQEVRLATGDRIVVGGSVLEFRLVASKAVAATEPTVVASRVLGDLNATMAQQLSSLENLSAAYQLEQEIGLAFEPERVLDVTLATMLRVFPAATHVMLLLVDKRTLQPKRQVAFMRGREGRLETELPVSTSVANRVLQEGRSLLFRDVAEEFKHSESVAAADIRSSMCAPLWTGEETVGLIEVESRGRKVAFTEQDLDRLTLFANRAALAIVGSELAVSEQRTQMMRDLSDMITHDLKGPLSSILGFLELLGEEQLTDDQREYLGFSFSAAKWLATLIGGILDVARMEAGEIKLAREDLDLGEEISQALSLIEYQFREKNIRLETAAPPDLPPVPADREIFRRIVINLVGNAVALSPEGSKISVSVAQSGTDEALVVSVQDEGPGIPKEYQTRIFDKFFQAGSRQSSHRKISVGLGLTFCKLAVEAHGGSIWVESEPGHGARFSFSLPLSAPPPGGD